MNKTLILAGALCLASCSDVTPSTITCSIDDDISFTAYETEWAGISNANVLTYWKDDVRFYYALGDREFCSISKPQGVVK